TVSFAFGPTCLNELADTNCNQDEQVDMPSRPIEIRATTIASRTEFFEYLTKSPFTLGTARIWLRRTFFPKFYRMAYFQFLFQTPSGSGISSVFLNSISGDLPLASSTDHYHQLLPYSPINSGCEHAIRIRARALALPASLL